MAETKQIKRALISVFHKDGLDDLLKKLDEEGVNSLVQVERRSLLKDWATTARK
jgi:AICAR transformylase/IMP cyclohydrolase PurH